MKPKIKYLKKFIKKKELKVIINNLGFYKGISSTLLGNVLSYGIYFYHYEYFK